MISSDMQQAIRDSLAKIPGVEAKANGEVAIRFDELRVRIEQTGISFIVMREGKPIAEQRHAVPLLTGDEVGLKINGEWPLRLDFHG